MTPVAEPKLEAPSTSRPSSSSWHQTPKALQAAMDAEKAWQVQVESLTKAIEAHQTEVNAILADTNAPMADRAKKLAETRATVDLLLDDLDKHEGQRNLGRWQEILTAALVTYESRLKPLLAERHEAAMKEFLQPIDLGALSALRSALVTRSTQTGIEHDLLPSIIASLCASFA